MSLRISSLSRLLGASLPFLALALALRAADAPPPLPALSPELAALEPSVLVKPSVAPVLQSNLEGGLAATLTPLAGSTADAPAYRIENPTRHRNHYAVEAFFRTDRPVSKGSALLARFQVRTLQAKHESGEGTFGFYFQQTARPWHKCIQVRLSVGRDWQLIEIPFTASRDLAAGESAVYLSFAYFAQTLEMSAPEVLDFGNRIPAERLPRTRFTYGGREADAPWRAAALERIETLRTAPLTVQVLDDAGRPVPGARVRASLTRPAFIFGGEIDTAWIMKDTADAERYRQLSLELFSAFTPGSGLKWQRWFYPTAAPGRLWTRDETLRALDWIESQGVPIKGHVLVWGGWQFTPREVRNIPPPERERRLPELIDGFIRDVTAATRDRVFIWEVLNEPVNEPDYINALGEETAAGWFKLARELAPKAQLFINDYRMLVGGDSRIVIDQYLGLISRLRAHGAPLDGIGIQGHFGQQMPSMETILSEMDVLAGAGLPLHITEFDINTADEQLQADFTRDFLIACYSHPAFTGFFKWGFWEGTHWIPQAAMYRRDWSIKPNGQVWRDLVLGNWRTRIDETTTREGLVSARGHFGRYEIEVSAPDGRVARLVHEHSKGASAATVTLR